ncbi:MAG: carboxypeptidase-like regulatory domain-containing protein [Planctomycetaceae bacterium]|jgi:hypothetical protein|nr:carboxypeptidase-like regulatory domain-containing protein [Planctomycetaceae bacterium]
MAKQILISGMILFFSVWLLVSGCNKTKAIKTDIVTGKVTFNGTPFAGATVNFTPKVGASGNPAYAVTAEDGTYKLQTLLGNPDAGTTPGEYVVTISRTENAPSGKKISDPDHPGKTLDEMRPKEVLPIKYKNTKTTPLTATVVADQANTFDFELTN